MPRIALAVVVLIAGCTTTTSPPPPSTPDTPPAAPQPQPGERHPGGGEIDLGEGTGAPPAPLGAACTEARWCGKSGKVAVVRESIHNRPTAQPPCAVIATSSRKNLGMNATSACIDGPRVFVLSRCIMCRINSEERLLGLVEDMTPEQLLVAQNLGGFPSQPLLTTTQAWAQAIAAANKASL